MSWVITGREAGPADPFIGSVSLLLHGNGTNGSTTITDSSLTPKTVTAFGNAQISTAQSKFGGASIAFDGAGDYLATNLSIDNSFIQNNFTIECWIYPTSTSEGGAFGLIGNQYFGVRLQSNFDNFYFNGSSSSPFISMGSSLTRGAWNHIAMTKSGATGYGFVNGVSTGSTSVVSPSITTSNLHIGFYYNTPFVFAGYIDEFRVTTGIARYTANFTPPTAPFPDI
jgi:hypothetical protein